MIERVDTDRDRKKKNKESNKTMADTQTDKNPEKVEPTAATR